MAAPDYKKQRIEARAEFVKGVEKSNVRNLVPSKLIASQAPSKSRSKAMRKLHASHAVIPAIRSTEGVVTRGLPGETHYDVIQREASRRGISSKKLDKLDDLIDEYFKPKKGGNPGELNEQTGFSDTKTGEYLTREEAAAKTKSPVGESMRIHKESTKVPLAERLAVSRRGAEPAEASKLLSKRKQTGRILSGLNDRIAKASSSPSLLGKLLNRRGVVRSIARKSRYLGAALAAGDAIKNFYDTSQEQ
jgi:hypothetical protein